MTRFTADAHQKGFDPHVEQPVYRAGSIVGVEGTQHEVAGKGRFDGDFRRFEVPYLADHDDIRVLTEKRAQGGGEAEADSLVHLHLVYSGEIVFNRGLRLSKCFG